MQYFSIDDARDMPGLRLVLSRGSPNPWGQAAKAIFRMKGIPFVPVVQDPGLVNDALRDWTGQTSAPVAMLDDERPRPRWNEILLLAERLQSKPALIPQDPAVRCSMFGLLHEMCDEEGLAWSFRILMFNEMEVHANGSVTPGERPAPGWSGDGMARRKRKYSNGEAFDAARSRLNDVLNVMDSLLIGHPQDQAYLIGGSLSAADIYWAAFSTLVAPLDSGRTLIAEHYQETLRNTVERFGIQVPRRLLHHRDRILEHHFALPIVA